MLSASACLGQRLAQSSRLTSLWCRAPSPLANALRLSQSRPLDRAYNETRRYLVSTTPIPPKSNASRHEDFVSLDFTHYPRAEHGSLASFSGFKNEWTSKNLVPGTTADDADDVAVVGRIHSIRRSGSKLVFLDVAQSVAGETLQIVLDNSSFASTANPPTNLVKKYGQRLRRGDTISVTGKPYRTNSGEISVRASSLPKLLAPCLHERPTDTFGDDADYAHDRHVQMMTDPNIIASIVARSTIISTTQDFFRNRRFTQVQTPILGAAAGGAIARPFETSATEFPDRLLSLRIAPELWLKRLIIGGMDRVFEIGPSFRNEGIDKTHNPEFTTCEFYAIDWTLPRLQMETRALIETIAQSLPSVHQDCQRSLGIGQGPWREIDFIPALNKALDLELPNLSSPSAHEQLLDVFQTKDIPLPQTPTLPRLLDKLASLYLESSTEDATWIINTPECLSPLAKSFPHPDLPYQKVAARAELFIHKKEVVNCYEEENSPVEQRRKFMDQQIYARHDGKDVDTEAMMIDEDYIKALEWGLPPTGGWGCGIDRLCMLMLGKTAISDVLTFGNLRMVTRGAEKRETTKT